MTFPISFAEMNNSAIPGLRKWETKRVRVVSHILNDASRLLKAQRQINIGGPLLNCL
jgi:hypothetical protein